MMLKAPPPKRVLLIGALIFLFSIAFIRNSKYTLSISPSKLSGDSAADGQSDHKGRPAAETVHEVPGQGGHKIGHNVGNPPKGVTLPTPFPKPKNYSEGPITPIRHLPQKDKARFIKQLTEWEPLNTPEHWPGWGDYNDADYDPNRWEGFDWETNYFVKGGLRQFDPTLVATPYLPYPGYNGEEWKKEWKGNWVACEGPRGVDLDKSADDIVHAYKIAPPNFPAPAVGSAQVIGLDEQVCFDRYNRYGAYGFGQGEATSPADYRTPEIKPDWSTKHWGKMQDDCLERNKNRYAPDARTPMNLKPIKKPASNVDELQETDASPGRNSIRPKYQHRTALLIRTWEGYTYTDNDLEQIRALVTELSLLTGGEYQVYLLVNVKEYEADIYDDPIKYKEVLERVVPPELRDIALLWTEKVCEEYYPDVGDWQVYWQQFMPLQWFSKTHPEFDYVWNWETDARYTGNHYQFLEKVSEFARNMPRKNLWERNSRFYIPSAHGTYASFLADTDSAIANATRAGLLEPVWGPQPYSADQVPIGPSAPLRYEDDNFLWGAGEEADLVTLQPIWDPQFTEWSYRYKIWNYIKGKRPHFSAQDPGDDAYYHPDFATIPRRVFINTVARFSRKMIHAMHMENRVGRSMQAEMWPATVALQHGLKAVYAPHPIWLDRRWPAWFLDATFNADGGDAAAWGQRRDSPYNHDREAAFRGWSWYYATGFPRVLFRRWLGWAARDILGDVGGPAFEDALFEPPKDQVVGLQLAPGERLGNRGRMCLPGMLLHPVKRVTKDDNPNVYVARGAEADRRKEVGVGEEVDRIRAERGFYWSDAK